MTRRKAETRDIVLRKHPYRTPEDIAAAEDFLKSLRAGNYSTSVHFATEDNEIFMCSAAYVPEGEAAEFRAPSEKKPAKTKKENPS